MVYFDSVSGYGLTYYRAEETIPTASSVKKQNEMSISCVCVFMCMLVYKKKYILVFMVYVYVGVQENMCIYMYIHIYPCIMYIHVDDRAYILSLRCQSYIVLLLHLAQDILCFPKMRT